MLRPFAGGFIFKTLRIYLGVRLQVVIILSFFIFQLKQSASDKLGHCENVKIDWGLNEVRVFHEVFKEPSQRKIKISWNELDYEQSPIFPQGQQQSERNANAHESHPTREKATRSLGMNRPLSGSKNSCFQSEAKCKTSLVKMSFICMSMKNSFSYQWLRAQPRFETEASGNLEMACQRVTLFGGFLRSTEHLLR